MARRTAFSGQMRFLPIADIFINAIACLLILIIISSRTVVSQSRTPKPDTILYCQQRQGQVQLFDGQQALQQPERFLATLQNESRIIHRLMVISDVDSFLACQQHMNRLLRKLKDAFEDPKAPLRPRSYLMLDIHMQRKLPQAPAP